MIFNKQLAAEYAALGLRYGIDVWHNQGGLRSVEKAEAALRALRKPWVILVERDGRRPYLACGDTREEAMSRVGAIRPGPNGPIDCYDVRRSPPLPGKSGS